MRKNRAMRVAALLLALTLITSCFVGSTFAKYTTSAEGSDTARVAHWGFNATTDNTLKGLFNTNTDTGVLSSDKTSDKAQLIAPGTTGTVTFTFVNESTDTTAPEVAYRIIVDTKGSSDLSEKLEAQLVFGLDKQSNLTWTELLEAIEKLAYTGDSNEYAPGTPVPDAFGVDAEHTITWAWSFDANDDDSAFGNYEIDKLEDITLAIKVTVEQLDTYTAPAAGN